MVTEPTRITEDTENILDLFFCNNPSLVNQVEVIPGISDHEVVDVESSLHVHPANTVTPPRKVHLYHKADFESLTVELKCIKEDFISMEPTSTTQELWNKFRSAESGLMKKYIPTKMLRGNKIKKPWTNRKVKSLMRRHGKLFTRMKKTRNETDTRKYKECKKTLQKAERLSYWDYVNNIIETGQSDNNHFPKQKWSWNYIKSLCKDSTGIAPLKDNGRLFNASKDKADILNRQYCQSVFTHEDPATSIPDPDGDPFLTWRT